MTRHETVIVTTSLAMLQSVFSLALVARADIYQWEYINPADPAQGKQQSTTLAPDGAGVNAAAGANLTLRDLTMAYLVGADLTGASAYSANLADAELSQANLANAKLGAYLTDPNSLGPWDGATLSGSNLTQANLTNADFSGYYAYNADAPDPVNSSVYYYGANFLNANFTGAEVRGANFTGSGGITLAQLYSTGSYQAHDLTGIKLPGHNLAGANLAGQNLTSADFSGFQISSFHELHPTDLTGADVRGANFFLANLADATTTNLIQSNGRISGLNLTSGASLTVRDYDGNPFVFPSTGSLPIVVDDHLTMDADGTLRLEFDADPWNSMISFAAGVPVALGGALELTFAADVNVAGQLGRTIDLFDWTGVTLTGAFSVSSPHFWDLSKLYTTGEVTLTGPGGSIFADFNGDSAVDSNDLTVWRSAFGTTGGADADNDGDSDGADFLAWQRQLGSELPSATSSAAVPEPSTWGLLTVLFATFRRCRQGGVPRLLAAIALPTARYNRRHERRHADPVAD